MPKIRVSISREFLKDPVAIHKEHKGKEQEKMKKISNALVALYPQDDVTINDATLFALLALNRKRFHTHHTVF